MVHIVVQTLVAFRIEEEGEKVEEVKKDQATEDYVYSAKKSDPHTSKL